MTQTPLPKLRGFKVVRVKFADEPAEKHEYWSATPGGRIVQYKVNEAVGRPYKCGPLAVFKTEGDAQAFFDKHMMHVDGTIFPCEYEPAPPHEDFLFYWNEYDHKEWRSELSTYPDGTAFANTVTLLLS